MKSFIKTVPILLMALTLQFCTNSDPISNQEPENIIYSNTFEADSDTTGWIGLSKSMFTNDPCPAEGKRSLHIEGGCIQPAASIELSAVKPGNYKIDFWGKMGQASQSARIVLKFSDAASESDKIEVYVTGTEWTHYKSEKSLFVPENKKLTLEIWVGGIIFADVYIDNLIIEK